MTTASGCPLDSSLSRARSRSWRALRLLSRAASSSSSSFLANLRQIKQEWERKGGWGWKEKDFLLFFNFSSPNFTPSPLLPFPLFRNFKGNDSLNWSVIIAVTQPAGFGRVFFSFYSSPIKLTCQLCNNQYFLSWQQFSRADKSSVWRHGLAEDKRELEKLCFCWSAQRWECGKLERRVRDCIHRL